MKFKITFPLIFSVIVTLGCNAAEEARKDQDGSHHGSVAALRARLEKAKLDLIPPHGVGAGAGAGAGAPRPPSGVVHPKNEAHISTATSAAIASPAPKSASLSLPPPALKSIPRDAAPAHGLSKLAVHHKPSAVPEVPKDPRELFRLGMQIKEQTGPDNDALFVQYIGLAAEQKHPDALFEMGLLRYSGARGVELDILEAARLWRLAGDNVGALYQLAQIIEEGYPGIPKSAQEALELYEKAMGGFFRDFQLNEEIKDYYVFYRREAARKVALHKLQTGVKWINDEGKRIMGKLCDLKDPEALFMMGSSVTENSFNSKDERELGIRRLDEAAAQDYAPALHLLGGYYEKGIYQILEIDLIKARKNYHKAAKLGYTDAINDLSAFDQKFPHIVKDRYYG